MGAWGIGILQNDTTADIWVEFKELYNKGLSPKEIRIKLEKDYRPQNDNEYYGEIWTGIAHGQWMCGELEEYTLKKVANSTNKKWLTLWKEDEKQLLKRIDALTDFIKKIQKPRSSTLKRRRIIDRPVYFKTGDIIGIKISQVDYLTAIVIGHDDHPTHGENKIVLTNLLFHETPPSMKEIYKSNILYFDIGGSGYYEGYFWALFSARGMSKKIKDTLLIDKFKIKKYLSFRVGIPIGDWKKIPDLYFEQVEFEKKQKTRKPFPVTVYDFLHPKRKLERELIEWDKKIFQEHIEKRRQAFNQAQ